MLRYKFRTLLMVLALGPPVLAGAWGMWRTVIQRPRTSDTLSDDELSELKQMIEGAQRRKNEAIRRSIQEDGDWIPVRLPAGDP